MTIEDVLDTLRPDEPNYESAASALGAEALPILRDLISGVAGIGIASKATCLASRLEDPAAREALLAAAMSDQAIIRVAAAGALQNLSADGQVDVALALLDDKDLGVRKVTMASLARTQVDLSGSDLVQRLEALVGSDPVPALREFAARTADLLRHGTR